MSREANRRNWIAAPLLAAGSSLAMIGSAFWITQTAAPPPAAHVAQQVLPGSTRAPVVATPSVRRIVGADTIATLSIAKIGLHGAPIVDQVGWGIAHGYTITHPASTARLGEGNAVLYGHDDIEGSVFARLQELRPGDQLEITTIGGQRQVYIVSRRMIVPPSAVQILAPTTDVQLTVFTCWPNFVDTQRVVIIAQRSR